MSGKIRVPRLALNPRQVYYGISQGMPFMIVNMHTFNKSKDTSIHTIGENLNEKKRCSTIRRSCLLRIIQYFISYFTYNVLPSLQCTCSDEWTNHDLVLFSWQTRSPYSQLTGEMQFIFTHLDNTSL